MILVTHQSDKLSDTTEYDKNRDCLNAWKQSLKQQLHMNHNQYLINYEKIMYAESWLIIRKKAHNLMS